MIEECSSALDLNYSGQWDVDQYLYRCVGNMSTRSNNRWNGIGIRFLSRLHHLF